MEEEKWKDIDGYEGIYQVSTLGRVKNISRFPQTLLSPGRMGRYYNVVLCNSEGRKTHSIHKLVAKAFLGDRPEGYEVSHIDEDGLNNRVDNLVYATHIENSNMPLHKIRLSDSQKGRPRPVTGSGRNGMAKAVVQYTRYGVKVMEYDCIKDAERCTGIGITSIANCLKGRSKSAGGYVWSYK